MKKHFFLFSIVLLLAGIHVNAQFKTIDSIKIYPPNPTTSDSIHIAYLSGFTSGPCDLQDKMINQMGPNSYDIDLTYCPGILTVICTDRDTITLPPQNAGSYHITLTLFSGTYDVDSARCTKYMIKDTASVNLTVSGANGVKETFVESNLIIRQSGKFISIQSPGLIAQLRLYDLSGRLVINREGLNEKSVSINTGNIEPGLYIVELRTANGLQRAKVCVMK